MDQQEYELMYRVELAHWWYQGMGVIARTLLRQYTRPGIDLRMLDAGCGTGGAMTTCLSGFGRLTGIDIADNALRFCKMRGLSSISRASVDRLPFPAGLFDVITSFDVLYERSVKNDLDAVKELARLLTPGGFLLLRLPAYNWLRGQHDEVVHTARRYTTGSAAELLQAGGLIVRLLSYANTFLFPLALAKRLTERFTPSRPARSDLSLQFGPLNGIFALILGWEAPLIARSALPFGLSVIALGQKI